MNKLYNRIYKAINEGIQKALLIDPEQNDVSINYSYHKIDNELDIQQLLNNAVHKFIEKPTVENYHMMLTYTMNNQYQYKVKDFNDFSKIFNQIFNFNYIYKIDDVINLSYLNLENIKNMITFITENGNEILLTELYNTDNVDNIVFIKFDHLQEFGHPIIIHKNLLISDLVQWYIGYESKGDSNNFYNGNTNTYYVNDIKNNLNDYPAFRYCVNINNYVNENMLDYKAYLPAINELKFIFDNINFLSYILDYIKGEDISVLRQYEYWSSTLIGNDKALTILPNGNINQDGCYMKIEYKWVLPLFAKIN